MIWHGGIYFLHFSGTLLKDKLNRSGSVFGRAGGFIVLIKCPFGIFENFIRDFEE